MDTDAVDLSDVRAKLRAAQTLCEQPFTATERRAMVGLILRLRHSSAVPIPRELSALVRVKSDAQSPVVRWWTTPRALRRALHPWLPSL